MADQLELTILMPCLNEAETLAACIGKAQGFLARTGIAGEVVIADNGSTDGSQDLARGLGARVVDVPERGYGAALAGGIQAARGRFVIMGDADDSYDFANLDAFVAELGNAYREWGFAGIRNHGIPQDRIDRAYDVFQRFFAAGLASGAIKS